MDYQQVCANAINMINVYVSMLKTNGFEIVVILQSKSEISYYLRQF